MICCLCGEQIEKGDRVQRITAHRAILNKATGCLLLVQEIMEDGTEQKIAHPMCMVERGYPLEVIGAGNPAI